MLKPRGRKYLFALAIICQVYLLVDSQTSVSLFIQNRQFAHTDWHSRSKFLVQDCATAHMKNPKCTKILVERGFAPDLTGEAYSAPAYPLAGGEGQ